MRHSENTSSVGYSCTAMWRWWGRHYLPHLVKGKKQKKVFFFCILIVLGSYYFHRIQNSKGPLKKKKGTIQYAVKSLPSQGSTLSLSWVWQASPCPPLTTSIHRLIQQIFTENYLVRGTTWRWKQNPWSPGTDILGAERADNNEKWNRQCIW